MRKELKIIKKIRVKNNDLWMEILDIALRHAPEETKELLANIRLNDSDVTSMMGDIIDEDSEQKDRA